MFSAKNKKLIKTKFNEYKAEADGLTDQSSKGRALRSIQQFDSVFKSLQGLTENRTQAQLNLSQEQLGAWLEKDTTGVYIISETALVLQVLQAVANSAELTDKTSGAFRQWVIVLKRGIEWFDMLVSNLSDPSDRIPIGNNILSLVLKLVKMPQNYSEVADMVEAALDLITTCVTDCPQNIKKISNGELNVKTLGQLFFTSTRPWISLGCLGLLDLICGISQLKKGTSKTRLIEQIRQFFSEGGKVVEEKMSQMLRGSSEETVIKDFSRVMLALNEVPSFGTRTFLVKEILYDGHPMRLNPYRSVFIQGSRICWSGVDATAIPPHTCDWEKDEGCKNEANLNINQVVYVDNTRAKGARVVSIMLDEKTLVHAPLTTPCKVELGLEMEYEVSVRLIQYLRREVGIKITESTGVPLQSGAAKASKSEAPVDISQTKAGNIGIQEFRQCAEADEEKSMSDDKVYEIAAMQAPRTRGQEILALPNAFTNQMDDNGGNNLKNQSAKLSIARNVNFDEAGEGGQDEAEYIPSAAALTSAPSTSRITRSGAVVVKVQNTEETPSRGEGEVEIEPIESVLPETAGHLMEKEQAPLATPPRITAARNRYGKKARHGSDSRRKHIASPEHIPSEEDQSDRELNQQSIQPSFQETYQIRPKATSSSNAKRADPPRRGKRSPHDSRSKSTNGRITSGEPERVAHSVSGAYEANRQSLPDIRQLKLASQPRPSTIGDQEPGNESSPLSESHSDNTQDADVFSSGRAPVHNAEKQYLPVPTNKAILSASLDTEQDPISHPEPTSSTPGSSVQSSKDLQSYPSESRRRTDQVTDQVESTSRSIDALKIGHAKKRQASADHSHIQAQSVVQILDPGTSGTVQMVRETVRVREEVEVAGGSDDHIAHIEPKRGELAARKRKRSDNPPHSKKCSSVPTRSLVESDSEDDPDVQVPTYSSLVFRDTCKIKPAREKGKKRRKVVAAEAQDVAKNGSVYTVPIEGYSRSQHQPKASKMLAQPLIDVGDLEPMQQNEDDSITVLRKLMNQINQTVWNDFSIKVCEAPRQVKQCQRELISESETVIATLAKECLDVFEVWVEEDVTHQEEGMQLREVVFNAAARVKGDLAEIRRSSQRQGVSGSQLPKNVFG